MREVRKQWNYSFTYNAGYWWNADNVKKDIFKTACRNRTEIK